MTIWITGASGFSAAYLAAKFHGEQPGVRVVGLGRSETAVAGFDAWLVADMTDSAALSRAAMTDPPDQVYHLAGAAHPASEESLWFTNVAGTRLLTEAVGATGKSGVRMLISSSAAVYRQTLKTVNEQSPAGGANAYGRSKWAQELIARAAGQEFGVEVVIARTFNLIGPGLPERLLAGRVCAQCLDSTSGRIETGDLSAERDFVDIRDAVDAYELIMRKSQHGEIYNVASGEGTPVRSLVGVLSELSGGLEVVESRASGHCGVDRSCGDSSRLQALGWSPCYSLKQSLRDMLDFRRC